MSLLMDSDGGGDEELVKTTNRLKQIQNNHKAGEAYNISGLEKSDKDMKSEFGAI